MLLSGCRISDPVFLLTPNLSWSLGGSGHKGWGPTSPLSASAHTQPHMRMAGVHVHHSAKWPQQTRPHLGLPFTAKNLGWCPGQLSALHTWAYSQTQFKQLNNIYLENLPVPFVTALHEPSQHPWESRCRFPNMTASRCLKTEWASPQGDLREQNRTCTAALGNCIWPRLLGPLST